MILSLVIFFLLIFLNFKYVNLDFFSIEDHKNFEKYSKYSKKIETKYGSCNYTPSYIIDEIPQISWNGYFLNNLEIKKEYRNQGYGTQLMNKIIDLSKKQDKLHLISQVVASNKPAIKLHEKVGFTIHSKGINKNGELVFIYIYYL